MPDTAAPAAAAAPADTAAPSAAAASSASPPDAKGLPPFLRFTPVPVRSRRDGWSPGLQLRFVVAIARGASVDEAARGLGRSRQTAYALRARSGAESFAAAWDAAAAFAARMRGTAAAGAGPLGGTLLVPRVYRGRLVGYVLREDRAGAMATLARLDRIADRAEARGPAAAAALGAYAALTGGS